MERDGQGHLIAIQKRNRNKTWPSENAPKRFVYLALVLWPTKPPTFDYVYMTVHVSACAFKIHTYGWFSLATRKRV